MIVGSLTSPTRVRSRTISLARVVVALVVALPIWLQAAPAGAHARLVETTPVDDELLEKGDADTVSLLFDEPMEITADAIRVFGPSGDRVDSSAARATEGSKRITVDVQSEQVGTYTVAWRATSADGHTLTGSFVFHVEVRTGARAIEDADTTVSSVVGGVGRWMAFSGMVAALGAIVFSLWAEPGVQDRMRLLAGVACLAGALGSVLVFWAQTASVAGRGLGSALSVLVDVGLGSRTGRLAVWRAAFLAAAAVAVFVRPLWRRAPWLALVPLGDAVVASSLSGHPWTASAKGVAVAADSLHLTAAGIWTGGVLALLLALPLVQDRLRMVKRFSTQALVLAIVVLLTGTISALFQVPSLDALFSTTFGRLLLVKVALFAGLVAIGWVNRARLIPELDRFLGQFKLNLRVEVALVAVLLAVTAVLVEQPPARVSVSAPFDEMVTTQAASMYITVEPARRGDNTIHLYFYDQSGSTPLPVDAVEVTAAIGSVPPRRLPVSPGGPSHVSVYDASLSAPGTWSLVVTAVTAGVPFTFETEVPIR